MADLSHVAVIFDLDGTLIDSAPDIHATANRVMADEGFAPLSRPQVQAYVGKGLPHLVASLLSHHGAQAEGALLARCIARFESEYLTAHSLTTLYAGAMAALSTLQAQGAALGLCTNKPLAPTHAILTHFGLTPLFSAVFGGDSLPTRKPDPQLLHATAQALNRRRTIFVGDSEVDAETAQAANQTADMPFLLYTEGYRKSPVDLIPHRASFSDWSTLPGLVHSLNT